MSAVPTFILFYVVLMPMSLLPMRILYGLGSVIRFVLCNVVKYRKGVILSNLRNSFPEKNEQEIKLIARKYYSHLADLMVEAVKMLTISRERLLERYKCTNSELVAGYFERGQSIILASAHYNNWEYMVASLDMQIAHHGIGVGKRMSNKAFEQAAFKRRTRYGTEVCYADNVRELMESYARKGNPCAYMLLSDQSPNNAKKCYWTTFLCQPTAVIYGAEYFAKKYDLPVLFYRVAKTRRGYYEVTFESLCDKPKESAYGSITETIARKTEEMIRHKPEYWLWSHRRWKLKPGPRNQ